MLTRTQSQQWISKVRILTSVFFWSCIKNVDRRESLCIYISAVWLTACRETMELLIKSRCPSERKRGC